MTPCPACGGQHLRDLVYQHSTSCRIYQADDATIANDYTNGAGIRPARNHERELINEQGYGQLAAGQYGIKYKHRGGIHQRNVVILDDTGDFIADAHRDGA